MTWNLIKSAILERYPHARAHGDDEVRLVVTFGMNDARVAIVICRDGDAANAVAQINENTTIRVRLALAGLDAALQTAARTALDIRRRFMQRPEHQAFAHAL